MKKILFCAAHCFFKIQLVILGLFILGAFSVPSLANAQSPAPVVAIHVSELTQALETLPAVSPTPTWDGTSGYQWWYTSWHYFVAYESLKEALRSDGTPFVEVSDSDIAAGSLLNSDGSPRYPILFSLASEAIADNEIAPLIDYVSAGGFLFTGSSAFTRYPDGASRGDFALADWMAVHMTQSTLLNWYLNGYFTKSGDHRLTSHIPDGTLLWSGPASAEQIPWVTYPDFSVHGSHYAWEVVSTGATVIANGENGPLLTVKSLGQGQMIYHGTLQPLIGHGGYDPGMYAYLIYRRAIEWAFESFSMPLVKVSPWPYSYEAAFMVRHDFENDQSSIMAIKESAQFEHEHGAKGDYYFSTGALREDMLEDPVTIADIRSAVSNYGATIGSHNGGLKNPIDASLSQWDYEYWHWGPDEVLDLFPPGYENGKAYATASIQTSFLDIERWLADLDNGRPGCGSLNNCPRTWVSPFFDSTREDSCDIVEQLGSVVMGEQKISPFPHRTLSYQTKGKYFYPISLPVSDWYVDGDIAQSTEYGHSIDSIRAGVDFYYNLGFLINFYGHLPSNNGSVAQEYVTYGTSKPSLWLTNAVEVNDWWRLRATAVVTPTFAINGNTITLTASVSGSVDPATAIEIALPQISDQSISGLSVFLDETPASSDAYRITSYGIKIRVGSTVSNVRVQYSLSVSNSPPVAENDSYSVSANTTFNQVAPGVLSNDSDPEGLALTAQLVGGPAHGSLTLNADGSFIYTPITNYVGSDSFTYRAYDGTATSNLAAVTITVTSSAGVLFSDDFSRSSGASDTLAPWVSVLGTWTVENGVLHG
ncbi:Ig-like domain-containing protein, partial [Marinobacter sp.]|uniref:Ig-like domain-containing protein n=1 Tax=Marinobacter sp. TaxID=50741 RepID=UPI00356B3C63